MINCFISLPVTIVSTTLKLEENIKMHGWIAPIKMGAKPDDNSTEYHQKMQAYIDKINEEKIVQVFYQDKTKKTINMVDKDEIMRKLATRLVSQQELSAKLKPEPSGIDAFETEICLRGMQVLLLM